MCSPLHERYFDPHLQNKNSKGIIVTKIIYFCGLFIALYLIVIILLNLSRILLFSKQISFSKSQEQFCMEGWRVGRRKQGKNEHLTTQKLGSK